MFWLGAYIASAVCCSVWLYFVSSRGARHYPLGHTIDRADAKRTVIDLLSTGRPVFPLAGPPPQQGGQLPSIATTVERPCEDTKRSEGKAINHDLKTPSKVTISAGKNRAGLNQTGDLLTR